MYHKIISYCTTCLFSLKLYFENIPQVTTLQKFDGNPLLNATYGLGIYSLFYGKHINILDTSVVHSK